MANKTFNQYCAIAHALDIIGERWTLLVVRNLITGPKRFSDLMKGLPGISTNVLTSRLKTLEAHHVITNRHLPPPAASTVYELTTSGFELTLSLSMLAQWGAKTLGSPQPEQYFVPESIAFMVVGIFWKPTSPEFSLTCLVHVNDNYFNQTFGVQLSPRGVQFAHTPQDSANIKLKTTLEPLLMLSSNQMTLRDALNSEQIEVVGDTSHIDLLIEWVDS